MGTDSEARQDGNFARRGGLSEVSKTSKSGTNKLTHRPQHDPVSGSPAKRLHFWPIDRSRGQDKQGVARIIGYPDASYRNNSDSSSQRGQCVLLAKPRDNTRHSAGSLVDYESQKITNHLVKNCCRTLLSHEVFRHMPVHQGFVDGHQRRGKSNSHAY